LAPYYHFSLRLLSGCCISSDSIFQYRKGFNYKNGKRNMTFGTGVLYLIQINHQPDATVFQFIILTFVYSSTSFGRFPAHHQELNDCSDSLWFYLRIVVSVVLCSWSGRPARPRTQHDDYGKGAPKCAMSTAPFRPALIF
jgi:hypothetical protein